MSAESLALHGGQPVRSTPFPPSYLGASLLGEEELALLTEVIKQKAPFRHYGMSNPHFAADFEREVREYLGVRFALAVNSGTAALQCSMAALELGPGDEVVLPAFSWWSNYQAVVLAGATPVFAEVDQGLGLDPADFAKRITPRTKAVTVVHFQGAAADLTGILEVANRHNIAVIEDVAQAPGASWQGRKLGSIGKTGCFSLQQNKVVTSGEGGVFVTDDPILFERAVRFHDLGLLRPAFADHLDQPPRLPQSVGAQLRMSELTAAVALAQWRKLEPAIVGPTRKAWRKLKATLKEECPGIRFRVSGDDEGDIGIALFVDCGTGENAELFSKALKLEGIPVGATSSVTHIVRTELTQARCLMSPAAPPFGVNQPGENVTYDPEGYPATDEHWARLVAIPIVPAYTDADLRDLGRGIMKVWKHLTRISHKLRRETPHEAGGNKAGDRLGQWLCEYTLSKAQSEPNAVPACLPQAAADGL